MTNRTARALPLLCGLLLLAVTDAPAAVPPEADALAARAMGAPDLAIQNVLQPPARLPGPMAQRLQAQISALGGSTADGYYDLRAGRWGTLVLAAPLVPGRGAGNTLTWAALGQARPADDAAYKEAVWRAFKSFLEARRDQLGIDTRELQAPSIGSYENGRLVHVLARRVVDGVPVRNAFVKATVNNGNLVLYGAHNWGPVEVRTAPGVAAARAQDAVAAQLAGFDVVGWRRPELVILPAARGEASAANEGRGYRHVLAWAVGPRVAGSAGSWEGLVDAHTGDLLALYDMNLYADQQKVVGGIFPVSNDGASPGGIPDGVEQPGFPMSRAYVFKQDGTQLEANSEGLVSASGQYRTHLSGPFLRIVDNCGVIDESTTCPALDLGLSGGTDCAVPAGASPGNTHSARTGFYEVNRLIDQAKSWMGPTATPNAPGGWLHRQLPANMNVNNSCNAFFSPTDATSPTTGSINFYREVSSSPNSGLCRNTGEIAAVFDHEWGHGLDTFDNAGGVSLPGEAYADMAAIMRLNTSCIGRGFFTGGTCGGNGDPCTECTGVREDDWTKRLSGRPHDLKWVLGANPTVPGSCGAVVVPPTPFNSGPCQRGTHCEGTIIGEAMWDLLKRDLRCHTLGWNVFAGGPVAGGRCTNGVPATIDENSALVLVTRLFYLAGEGVTLGYQCDQTFTSAGCNAGSWYLNLLAADDDDGLIANGTPHMAAIHDAFLRHGISCPSDSVPPSVRNFGCAATPAPTGATTVTATAGEQSATITWTPVAGAAEYWVLRTDGVHGCDFGKTRVARIAAGAPLAFSQDGLLDGLTYYYSVVAVGGAAGVVADSCAGPMSACAAVTPLPPDLSSGPSAAVEDTGAAPVMETGDGDPFLDNCETASLTFDVVNTGGGTLTNVRVTAIQPSAGATQILTTLPIAVGNLGAGCGGTSSTAPVTFRFRAGGLAPQSTMTFLVAVEASGLPAPVSGVLTVTDTETDLSLGDVAFGFEDGAQGWTASSGTFTRTNVPPPGANGSAFYMKSSSGMNDACDRARSPKVRLTAASTLSLQNQFLTEPESAAAPFYDRGNVGIVDAQGQRTIVSPDGGRAYNALNSYTGCNNGPGWATSVSQPVNQWAQSTWSASALGAAGYAGQEVQVEVTNGTDALSALDGLQFDEVRLTSVLLKGPDGQSDTCSAETCVVIDDGDRAVEYRTGWHKKVDARASNGSYHQRTGKNTGGGSTPTVRVVFDGTSITYAFVKTSAGGSADLYLDGVLRATVGYSSGPGSDATFGHTLRYEGLGAGTHEFKLVHRTGVVTVDGFRFGCSGGGPATAAAQYGSVTTTSTATSGEGPIIERTVDVGSLDQDVSVVVTGGLVPLTVRLLDPAGRLIATGEALIAGLTVSGLDKPVSAPGSYRVQVVNVPGGFSTIQISMARTFRHP